MHEAVNFLKGMVVGLANIIPGVSGGTMLVSMGLYEKLIQAVTTLTTRPRRALRFLVPILAGAAVSVLLLSRIFSWLLVRWPIPTNFAFIGLILGSLPVILKQMRFKKKRPGRWVGFWIFFALVIVSALFASFEGGGLSELHFSLSQSLVLFIVGIVAAATMVIPGVSGSMVLMIVGYYYPILNAISSSLDALRSFHIAYLIEQAAILLFFGLGVLVGIFLVARLVQILFRLYRQLTLFSILGLILASPIAIFIQIDWSTLGLVPVLLAIPAFAAGFFFSRWLTGLK